jgi:hypothetical protein
MASKRHEADGGQVTYGSEGEESTTLASRCQSTPICAWCWSVRWTSLYLIGALPPSCVRDAVGNAASLRGLDGLDGRAVTERLHASAGYGGNDISDTRRISVRLACKSGASHRNRTAPAAVQPSGVQCYSIKAAIRSAASSCKPGTTCE